MKNETEEDSLHLQQRDGMYGFEERRELQGKRLRETVELEYNNVPAYRKRMDKAGVKPEDIKTIDDIVKLPFMQKTDLRDNFPYGLFAAPLKDMVRIQGSSGTTGKPIVTGYTKHDVDVWTEMVARAITAAGGGKDDIIQIAYGYGLFTGGLGAHQGATKVGAIVLPMSSGNTQRQITMLKELGSTMLCCTPSYATYLAETIREWESSRRSLSLSQAASVQSLGQRRCDSILRSFLILMQWISTDLQRLEVRVLHLSVWRRMECI